MIKVESPDGMVFELDHKVAEQSLFIKETIQYCVDPVNAIQIPSINGKILSIIVNFCRKHTEPVDFNGKVLSMVVNFFELADECVSFSKTNALHFKTMEEMSKSRKQLLQLVFY